VIDGEAVIPGIDGIADFDALHSGKQNGEVQLCAFDVLATECDDLRDLSLIDAQGEPRPASPRGPKVSARGGTRPYPADQQCLWI
jgi:hypothetical protein